MNGEQRKIGRYTGYIEIVSECGRYSLQNGEWAHCCFLLLPLHDVGSHLVAHVIATVRLQHALQCSGRFRAYGVHYGHIDSISALALNYYSSVGLLAGVSGTLQRHLQSVFSVAAGLRPSVAVPQRFLPSCTPGSLVSENQKDVRRFPHKFGDHWRFIPVEITPLHG